MISKLNHHKKINFKTVIQRKKDLLFNQIDGEMIMLSIKNNEYYGMDKVGSRIWELIENPLSFKQLVEILQNEFEVDEKRCEEDAKVFIESLLFKELIETL